MEAEVCEPKDRGTRFGAACGTSTGPDPSQFDEFYRRYFLPLVRRATWKHRLEKEDARDVVQEAFLVALVKLDARRNPKAWLIQVVDHLAVNFQRKVVRRAKLVSNGPRARLAQRVVLPLKKMKSPIARQTPREATIRNVDGEMFQLIPAWLECWQGRVVPLGKTDGEAFGLADRIRLDLRSRHPVAIDLANQDEASDALHALFTRLSEDCANSPELVLEEAESIGTAIESVGWVDDDMEERERFLVSFAFIAWRSARILGLAHRAQRWESGSARRSFRQSLCWEVAESIFESEGGTPQALADVPRSDAEGLFQVFLYLEDHREAYPKRTSAVAEDIYRSLHGLRLPKDIHSFFLAEAARIVGGALRQISWPDALKRWCDLAESHLENDPNPNPTLTRIAFLRLASLYEQSRYEIAAKSAPALEKSFAAFGMEEDRVSVGTLGRLLNYLAVFKRRLESYSRSEIADRTFLQAFMAGYSCTQATFI